ncbi:MAG: tetratricopeptide repeat protein [Deltaproteobacteria bacterium]|nr:tetratricopeptide repeat protein [Deltaproteobacteria bacterium]MBW2192168.1 tetratricopeptide repeat protein [Deltaproteobacteria bacterium]
MMIPLLKLPDRDQMDGNNRLRCCGKSWENVVLWGAALFFYTVVFLLLPFGQTATGSVLEIDADMQFKFAEDAFDDADYATAVAEYKRFVYFFPEDKRVERAGYKIGLSYFKGRRYTAAIDSFEAVIKKYGETDLSRKSYFLISDSYVELKDFGPAVINLKNLITVTEDPDVKDEAYYRTGWIHLETESWEKARLAFQKISEQNRNRYLLERLSDELDNLDSISKKDPALAGILSVVPGAGYLYCERYRDALIAFLVNGALIFAAYESFDNDHDALGGILTVVGLGFYAGNIYGAVNSAHKYNRAQTNQFIQNLKSRTRIRFSASPERDIVLTFQYRF